MQNPTNQHYEEGWNCLTRRFLFGHVFSSCRKLRTKITAEEEENMSVEDIPSMKAEQKTAGLADLIEIGLEREVNQEGS